MTDDLIYIASGDEPAFRQFYHQYFDRLYRLACNYVPAAEEAEEVVSDVFLKIWLRREALAGIRNITTYLYVAVRNTALNYLEKKSAENGGAKDQYIHIRAAVTASLPDDILISKENERAVELAVNQLPANCKMIFRLVREDGLKYREVAEILGVSVNTVNTQMAIASKKISKSLRLKQKANLL